MSLYLFALSAQLPPHESSKTSIRYSVVLPMCLGHWVLLTEFCRMTNVQPTLACQISSSKNWNRTERCVSRWLERTTRTMPPVAGASLLQSERYLYRKIRGGVGRHCIQPSVYGVEPLKPRFVNEHLYIYSPDGSAAEACWLLQSNTRRREIGVNSNRQPTLLTLTSAFPRMALSVVSSISSTREGEYFLKNWGFFQFPFWTYGWTRTDWQTQTAPFRNTAP